MPSLLYPVLIVATLAIAGCGGGSDPTPGPSQPSADPAPTSPGDSAPPGQPVDEPAPGTPVDSPTPVDQTPAEPSPSEPPTENPPPGEQPPVVSEPDSNQPFGLQQREALAEFNLPLGGVDLGSSYSAVNAYPNLSFNAALYASGIPGESRIVLAEQAGVVKVFEDDPNVQTSRVVLDISSRVLVGGEEGLIGMALDPDFQNNRYVYLHYTRDDPLRSVISRFTWDSASDQILDPSEKTVLEIPQPFHNHNGGALVFGPDNYLYIGSGDGGDGGDPFQNAQNLNSLLGKVLRIDVHPSNPNDGYAIPPDNPFVNRPDARPEVYAYGLRNPYRFSFDRQTSQLWLGDVGQEAFEEIDLIVRGGNYGWRIFEGNSLKNEIPPGESAASYIPPVTVYDHSQGVAVIGGNVYRGSSVSSLIGRYIYADFSSGTVWSLNWDGQSVVSNEVITTVTQPSSFGESNNGELLIVTRYSGLFKLSADSSAEAIPTSLSQTGLFSDLSSLTPASGLIEYQPSHPFWSDGASKRRWAGVPANGKVEFSDDNWVFPRGSVAVKHFEYNQVENNPATARRLETRVMLHTDKGWEGFTYRWNQAQTDAELVSGRVRTELAITAADGSTRQQPYDFPSQADCKRCHTVVEDFTLGLNTPQLNSDYAYPAATDNQIRSWNNIGLFNRDVGGVSQYSVHPAIDDQTAGVEARARAYLDVNCSVCHQPGGPTPVNLDFRAGTDSNAMNAIGVSPSVGDLGIANARIIAAGDRQRSMLWQRMLRLDDQRMPPLSSHVVDQTAVDLIGQWIDSLSQ